jgi:predicted nucleic acid-binding protein
MRAIYLDACVIIDLREKANGASGLGRTPGLLRELLVRAARGQCRLATSELSLAECLVEPLRIAGRSGDEADEARRRVEWYRTMIHPGGVIPSVSMTRDILVRAAELRARQRSLKLPDAIHLASAEAAQCTDFITRDARLSRWLDDGRMLEVPGVRLSPASDQALEHLLRELQPS